jgi:formylglycine-generating enzyme required for sulfatase activity
MSSKTRHRRRTTSALSMLACLVSFTHAQAGEPYAGMLEKLRSEISAKLPPIADATRKGLVETKDAKARVEAVRKIPALDGLLSNHELDARLATFFILNEATPAGLSAYAAQGAAQKKLIDTLLADEKLMREIAVADGALPLHGRKETAPPHYGKVMEIYSAIRQTSPKANQGVLQRLALAVSLEFGGSAAQSVDGEDSGASKPDTSAAIDPVKRYLHYEKAYEAGELDANFDLLSVWELRFVVCATERDDVLAWGREMLRNFRPDHVYTENDGWRYANLVNSDVQYGSINVGNDRPELAGMQNILMNGGICGRRAFFARYICRAFGIPATARPSSGHGASARWTPQGWVVVLGPGWGHGTTHTRYGTDLNFLATTQARARGGEFLKVKRAYWIGDVMGEPRTLGERDHRAAPAFWNAVALATQGRIIEDSKAVTLDALGAEFGESNGPTVAEGVIASAIKQEDSMIVLGGDGTITIPAVAYTQSKGGKEDEEEKSNDLIPMKSFSGGMQLFLPNFNRQQPILVRGGTWKHEASLCESATRHWKGRRPKNSFPMRGLRLAVTPDGAQAEKELKIELADGVTMDFIYMPPGTFTMGGDRPVKEGDILADTPKHEVTLTRGFYLAKYEMTQSQYAAVMDKDQGSSAKGPDHPVDGVKPSRALLLCDTLSARTGREVRLPTEAEWEYAARANTTTRWFFGDDPSKLGEYAWFKDNAQGKSHPVGQKKPNPWGLYDMYGNIAEFVRDEHQEDYYAKGPKVDPAGPSLGTYSNMEFSIDAPKAGDYILTAKVCTSNYHQTLQLAVNESGTPTTIKLPFTLGKWQLSEPLTLTLKQGKNSLRFWRDQAPQSGVAVKEFTLKPAGAK